MDEPIGSQLFLQVILIMVNAFFAATETSVVSLNENKIRKQAESGDAKAKLMLKVVEAPTKFLSTIQVCITLSGFLASAFASENFASRLCALLKNAGFTLLPEKTLLSLCMVLVTLILSFFMIVLGELAPKRIALQYPEKIARFTCGVINFMSKLFTPIVWLLSASTNLVLKILGIKPDSSGEEVTEEEIRMMVDIGSESGAIEQDERTMIENIFEFNNMTAADVMVHRIDVVALHVDDSQEEILSTIQESGLSRFPVYADHIDDIVGVLNTRDFLLNTHAHNPKTVKELLRSAYLVPETVPADTLFNDMQKQKVHLAIVVDEYGGMSGIVTMEDLLEEIVGNIYDEFDPTEEKEIELIDENLWRVDGSVDLETLADTLDIALPLEEEYDTLGGMIFSTFSSIPEDGSNPELDIHGLHIKVETICDHRIETVLLSKLEKEEDGEEADAAEEKD